MDNVTDETDETDEDEMNSTNTCRPYRFTLRFELEATCDVNVNQEIIRKES